jgi:hypothetical protein
VPLKETMSTTQQMPRLWLQCCCCRARSLARSARVRASHPTSHTVSQSSLARASYEAGLGKSTSQKRKHTPEEVLRRD